MGSIRKIEVMRSRVKEILKIRKKSLKAVCIKARIPYETVRFCLREGMIMPDILQSLARELNCRVRYLTGEESINAALWGNLLSGEEEYWIDSQGILIKPYESVQYNDEDEVFYSHEESAARLYEKMAPHLAEFLSINFTDQNGNESEYSFSEYINDLREIEFYSSFSNVLGNKKYDPSKVSLNMVYDNQFNTVCKALRNDMNHVRKNKEKIISAMREEITSMDQTMQSAWSDFLKKLHNFED